MDRIPHGYVIYCLFITALLIILRVNIAVAQSDEDRPDQVWNLDIEGNKSFSDIIIKDQIATDAFSFWDKLKFWKRTGHPINDIELKKDIIRIGNYYNRRGFPNTTVRYRVEEGSKSWKKHVIFTVNEQASIRIINMSYDFSNSERYRKVVMNDSEFKDLQSDSEFKVNGRYEPIKNAEIVGSYKQMYENMGFAYAQVDISAMVDTTQLSVDLTIKSSLGPLTYLENINVEGDSTVNDSYVIGESGLKIGNKYSLESIQEAQREIFNHHLFRFATISIPDQPRDSTLDLKMRVREMELRSINTSIGFGTEEYVRGQVSWIHRNAFGRAHKFTSSAQASFIEQTLKLDYLLPYVFNTKSNFVISPFVQHVIEDSYELSRMGITNSLIYNYSRNLTGSLSYQFTKNSELAKQFNEELPDTTQDYNLSSIQLSGYYNQGFNERSQKGWVIRPYAEISGFFGNATFKFQKLSLDLRRYLPITASTTVAMRVNGGKIFATAEDSLPNNIRYFLGGTNSIRGWGRNDLGPKRVLTDSLTNEQGETMADTTKFREYIAVGGRSFFGFNLEVRQSLSDLIDKFGIAFFLDGGQVWRKDPDFKLRPLQFSLGGGLWYESPIGPVRLDIGYKLNPSDEDLNIYQGRDFGNFWDRIGIHIGVGQSF